MRPRVARPPRFSLKVPLIDINGEAGAGAYLLDLSAMGARLEADFPLAPRHTVEFSILLPGTETATRLKGTVVWMRPLLEPPGRYQMGVKFYFPDWQLDQKLRMMPHPKFST